MAQSITIPPEHASLAMIWGHMIDRCYNPKHRKYRLYGGRGIYVDERWHDFRVFAQDMAPRPPGLSLDRIDVNGPYSKDNCRWATAQEQASNKRNNMYLTINGETKTVMEWSRVAGKCNATILHRIRNGWNPEEAVFGRMFAKRYPGITFNGTTMTATAWSQHLGLYPGAVAKRLRKGMSVSEALSPIDYRTKQGRKC